MPEAVIVDAVRTPIGRAFKGSLASLRPDETLAHVVAGLRHPLDQGVHPGRGGENDPLVGSKLFDCAIQRFVTVGRGGLDGWQLDYLRTQIAQGPGEGRRQQHEDTQRVEGEQQIEALLDLAGYTGLCAEMAREAAVRARAAAAEIARDTAAA